MTGDSMLGYVTTAPEVRGVLGSATQAIVDLFASGDIDRLDALAIALPTPEVISAVEAAKSMWKQRLETLQASES